MHRDTRYGDALITKPSDNGRPALAVNGLVIFNTYPEALRIRVLEEIKAPSPYRLEEHARLYKAFTQSPLKYLATLDEILCAKADALIRTDKDMARTALTMVGRRKCLDMDRER